MINSVAVAGRWTERTFTLAAGLTGSDGLLPLGLVLL